MSSNLPPGCGRIPGEDGSGPCECCGRDADGDCVCPECPECGESGNPHCYDHHGLKYTDEQRAGRAKMVEGWERNVEAERKMFEEMERGDEYRRGVSGEDSI